VAKNETYYEFLDPESKLLHDEMCSKDPVFKSQAAKMMTWLPTELQKQSNDPSIAWKASLMHHPMYGCHSDSDYSHILKEFLPLIQKNHYDVYFNGHEHQMSYAQTTSKMAEMNTFEYEN
jgi:hypothetical protein